MSETEITIRNQIAHRLRAAREAAGLSQGQVAKLLEYHRPTISEIEAGRRKVSGEEITKLAELYDVSSSWVLSAKSEVPDPKIELAARELSKLKEDDLDRVISLVKSFKKRP